MALKGIDISSWQGSVDFAKVKADGVQFAILREGYRKSVDGKFKEYVAGCKNAGVPILGVYHFIYWDGATIAENAASMITNVQSAGLDPTKIWLFADLEYDSWTKAGEAVTKAKCSQYTKQFLDCLVSAGCKKVGIYCNQDYYRNYMDWNVLKDYRDNLWLADYEGEPGYTCSIQQTGSTGKVNGISGNVDMDTLFDESMLNKTTTNTPKKSNEELAKEVLEGKWGNGEARKQALGDRYSAVQAIVNKLVAERDAKNDTKEGGTTMTAREAVVKQAQAWLGCNEADGSFKKIIDVYNNYKPWEHQSTCRRCAMDYSWHWCQCFVSAVFIKAGYASICPLEISCFYAVEASKKMGIWVEQDDFAGVQPGDIIEYDWDDSGNGENYGAPDHTGIVEVVNKSAGTITLIEGNCSEEVKRRTIAINGRYIRGWIVPKYPASSSVSEQPKQEEAPVVTPKKSIDELAKEVLDGRWGNGEARKQALTSAGYDYLAVQNRVNELVNGNTNTEAKPAETSAKVVKATGYATKYDASRAGRYTVTTGLNLRNGAGTNNRILVTMPKGTVVRFYGFYSPVGNTDWFFVIANVDGVEYHGHCSSAYLKRN